MVFLSKRNFKMEPMNKKILFAIPCLICKNIETIRINRIFNDIAINKDFDTKKYVGLVWKGSTKEINKKIIFKENIEMEFEDAKLYAPKGYNELLKRTYGDYMKFPPKEERVSNHMFEVWWND